MSSPKKGSCLHPLLIVFFKLQYLSEVLTEVEMQLNQRGLKNSAFQSDLEWTSFESFRVDRRKECLHVHWNHFISKVFPDSTVYIILSQKWNSKSVSLDSIVQKLWTVFWCSANATQLCEQKMHRNKRIFLIAIIFKNYSGFDLCSNLVLPLCNFSPIYYMSNIHHYDCYT